MRKHKAVIFMTFGFLVGVCILLYPAFSDYWNSITQSRAITDYESVLDNLTAEQYAALMEEAHAYNKALYETDFPLADFKKVAGYQDTLSITDNDMIGYLKIDRIGVELPIYHGTSDHVLSKGVGHLEGSSLPVGGENTHAVMSAHRGLPTSKLFTDLDRMEPGDTFQVVVLDQVLTYQVDSVKVISPDDLSDLQIIEGGDYCTLFTCTPYGINTHRMLVRGTRIENIEQDTVIGVNTEAYQIDPLIVTPAVAAPILAVLLIVLLVRNRNQKTGKKKRKAAQNQPEEIPQDDTPEDEEVTLITDTEEPPEQP